jgi:hypothetical protein
MILLQMLALFLNHCIHFLISPFFYAFKNMEKKMEKNTLIIDGRQDCIMCLHGDLEKCFKEICIPSECCRHKIVYKKCWVVDPVERSNDRVIVEMIVKGDYTHIRTMREPLQGRTEKVLVTRFLDCNGDEIQWVKECGTSQKSRIGSVCYRKGEITYMNVELAKNKLRTPWYPGIHFHCYFKDVVKRV